MNESIPDIDAIIQRYVSIAPGQVAELYIKLLKFRNRQLENAIKQHRIEVDIHDWPSESNRKLWSFVDNSPLKENPKP